MCLHDVCLCDFFLHECIRFEFLCLYEVCLCVFVQLLEQQGVIQRYQRQLVRVKKDVNRDGSGASLLDSQLEPPSIKVQRSHDAAFEPTKSGPLK